MIHTIIRSYVICAKLLAVIVESYLRVINAQLGSVSTWFIRSASLIWNFHLHFTTPTESPGKVGLIASPYLTEDSQLINFSKTVQVTPNQSDM